MDAQALGRYLRESREARELTLDDAETALRIRRRTLESFEQGNFLIESASPVQIRGFIRNYARYLDLDEQKILQYYEASLIASQPRGRKRRTAEEPVLRAPRQITDTNPTLPAVSLAELADRRSRRRATFFNRLMIVMVTLAALAIIVFVALQLVSSPQLPQPTLSASISGLIAQQPVPQVTTFPTFTPLPEGLVSAAGANPRPRVEQTYSGRGVLVTIRAAQRTWIQILSDGGQTYSGIMRPGDTVETPAQEQILVTASNAEALLVAWNGQQQGIFGGRGQKVDITFTIAGVSVRSGPGFEPTSVFTATPIPTSDIDVGAMIAALTPTSTPGPSPTPTDTPTITLTPSITPTPSDTPTPTYTPSVTPTPSDTPTPTPSPTVTPTPTATHTPTVTPTPSITPTPSPTAILPPRQPLESATPTKAGA